jgi:hypothetical protein
MSDSRFLWDLDSIIQSAKKTDERPGNARDAANLLNYFCREVAAGRAPDERVIAYVAYVLTLLYPKAVIPFRNRAIKKRFSELRLRGKRIRDNTGAEYGDATRQIKEEFGLSSCEYAIRVLYKDLGPVTHNPIGEFLFYRSQGESKKEHLEAIVPHVHKIALILIGKHDEVGDKVRFKLKLREYCRRPEAELHREIAANARSRRSEKRLNKKLAKEYGLTEVNIKKIICRENSQFKFEIAEAVQALINGHADPQEACEVVAKIWGLSLAEVKENWRQKIAKS